MQALQSLSFARVLLLSGVWILLCLLVAAAWLLFPLTRSSAASTGSGGIGLAVGINGLMLAILLVPPIILTLVWFVARRR